MSGLKLVVEDYFANVLGQVRLGKKPVRIGREADCEVTLSSPFISPVQARIETVGENAALRSVGLNSTYVNKQLVREEEDRLLAAGDLIELPGFVIRVVDERAPVARGRDELELMREFSRLMARLHESLLERADLRRLSAAGMEEEQRKKRIYEALDELLGERPELSKDLSRFILLQELRAALVNRVFLKPDVSKPAGGGGRRGSIWSRTQQRRAFSNLVDRCAGALELDSGSASVTEKLSAIGERLSEVYKGFRATVTPELRESVRLRKIRRDLEALVFGLGPLEELLHMPDLNEIMVIGRDRIFVEKSGGLEETGRSFPNDDDLDVVIQRIVAPIGRVVNISQPMVDARLSDGSRVNIVIPPVSLRGPAITIRKFRKEPFSLEDLVRLETLNQRAVSFLGGCVRARKNLIISGGTGSGKTTLLNTLSSQIPYSERIVVIEDSAELQLEQPNLVVLEAKKANAEGEGEIAIRDLVRNALRMRPDRVVVGECRGKEALDMLQAMNTGHDGSLTTAHANSPRELVGRLEVMVLEAGEGLPVPAIHRQIAGAVDVIIQIARQRDRKRRITHISEVVEFDPEEDLLVIEDIFRLVTPAVDEPPELRFTGYLPTFVEDLLDRGGVQLEDLF